MTYHPHNLLINTVATFCVVKNDITSNAFYSASYSLENQLWSYGKGPYGSDKICRNWLYGTNQT